MTFPFYSALTTSHLILSVPPVCSWSMLFLSLSALPSLPECHTHGSCLTCVCLLIDHRTNTVMLIYTSVWILSGFCFPCYMWHNKNNYICVSRTPIQQAQFPWPPGHWYTFPEYIIILSSYSFSTALQSYRSLCATASTVGGVTLFTDLRFQY